MAIRIKQVTYTPANIFAMFATPQIVLDAPATGYVNNILAITHKMEYDSVAYTDTDTFVYGNTKGDTVYMFYDSETLPATSDTNVSCERWSDKSTIFTTTEDFYVSTQAAAADGDSDVIAYIVYETKLIDT